MDTNPSPSVNISITDNQGKMMGSSIRQVHMADQTSEYGIHFVRQPLNEEGTLRRRSKRVLKVN
jgi:hypothetical protein